MLRQRRLTKKGKVIFKKRDINKADGEKGNICILIFIGYSFWSFILMWMNSFYVTIRYIAYHIS